MKTEEDLSQAGDTDRTRPILVVDDADHLRSSIAEVLMLEGYQVETAENGLVALESVAGANHSLILLDITMPILNGFEFLKAYERHPKPHTPIIILSGESNIERQVLPSFVVDVLPKPFEVSRLVNLVKRYV